MALKRRGRTILISGIKVTSSRASSIAVYRGINGLITFAIDVPAMPQPTTMRGTDALVHWGDVQEHFNDLY